MVTGLDAGRERWSEGPDPLLAFPDSGIVSGVAYGCIIDAGAAEGGQAKVLKGPEDVFYVENQRYDEG
jgi:hypothetical protein